MSEKFKFYLERYADAAENQMRFDRLDYTSLEKNFDEFDGLPRPTKWMVQRKLLPALFKGVSPVLRLLWRYLLGYIYFILLFLTSVLSIRKSASDIPQNRSLALAASQRSVDIISQAFVSSDVIWLTLPGVELAGSLNGAVNGNSLLGFKEKLEALFFSFKAHLGLAKYRELSFQTYTAYNWYCTAMCIEKIKPSKLIIAQHLDRWAILADASVARSVLANRNFELHLVQHGIELEKTYQGVVGSVGFNKLSNVTRLYVYNEDQLNIFNRFILDQRYVNGTNVVFFNSCLELYEIGSKDKLKVMFVGHSICEDLHKKIYLELASRFNFDFYYKPHPTTVVSARISNLGWSVIDGKKGFPKVDYLISYESTLVEEYKAAGVISFVHKIETSKEDHSFIIEKAIDFFLSMQVMQADR